MKNKLRPASPIGIASNHRDSFIRSDAATPNSATETAHIESSRQIIENPCRGRLREPAETMLKKNDFKHMIPPVMTANCGRSHTGELRLHDVLSATTAVNTSQNREVMNAMKAMRMRLTGNMSHSVVAARAGVRMFSSFIGDCAFDQ